MSSTLLPINCSASAMTSSLPQTLLHWIMPAYKEAVISQCNKPHPRFCFLLAVAPSLCYIEYQSSSEDLLPVRFTSQFSHLSASPHAIQSTLSCLRDLCVVRTNGLFSVFTPLGPQPWLTFQKPFPGFASGPSLLLIPLLP